MKLRLYSVFDSKAGVFHPPFFQHTPGEAERTFKELLRDEKSLVSKYPDDYDLYYLGEYDDQTGKIAPKETPEHLVKGAMLVAVERQGLNS